MKVVLTVISGPHQGKEFAFDGHDTFLVGRTDDAHLQLPHGDPFFSRRHFLVEVNPPRCRVIDLNSHNGTLKNGIRVQAAELVDGDEIGAGHTVFKVRPNQTRSIPSICQTAPRRWKRRPITASLSRATGSRRCSAGAVWGSCIGRPANRMASPSP